VASFAVPVTSGLGRFDRVSGQIQGVDLLPVLRFTLLEDIDGGRQRMATVR
jgi:hypothetical protein